MKIGVYVGSFNPVHKGHIKIANYVVNNKLVDKLLIIPTLNYWDKKNLIDLNYRVEMLKFFETDKIIVDNEFSNLEYTYQVINSLKKKYKNSDFSLIIGADNIVNFDKWKNYKKLLNIKLIIFKRDNIDVESYLKKLEKKDKYIIVNDLDEISISSTFIRDNIDNLSILEKCLDKRVINYIAKNNLYRSKNEKYNNSRM